MADDTQFQTIFKQEEEPQSITFDFTQDPQEQKSLTFDFSEDSHQTAIKEESRTEPERQQQSGPSQAAPPPQQPPQNPSRPGGFFPPSTTLPSPAPSNQSRLPLDLPHPRATALRPGSVKEDNLRRFVERRIMHINRRYVKKFGIPDPGDEVAGYQSISELCRDLDSVINMLWLSGTPGIQIPYFLNISHELTTWIDSFPPSPAAMLGTLARLDHCLASLIAGRDIQTDEDLPGFVVLPGGTGARLGGMSRTDMVRCRSIVEQTRLLVVDVMSRNPEAEGMDIVEDVTETEAETTDGEGRSARFGGYGDDEDDAIHLAAAKVYENTLIQLGATLGQGPIA
ncbi:hypothetical protein MGG_13774 [Pyricularia oryzae 70-15]|uniref:Meiotic recombination protein DMC1 n=1 Tax=Pyricularia oryzae (strain 70-15 / ATCC MYA-4617 / FGSC 8958) TaxID=242507 RepID=G4MR90_PYRO7|nr:uncharacterized protein MGG_13774 [Pyricularia oryzae 70-15]EHA58215.1 hypothetical protein MGG_13774 [Pyricularia oryzae 70-15]